MPYVFLSNASLAEPRSCRCMNAGLDSLKWSVNSSNEEDFARVMKVKPALFWKSVQNIKDAYTVRNHLHARTSLYARASSTTGTSRRR